MAVDLETNKRSLEDSGKSRETEIPGVNLGIILVVVALKKNGSPDPIPFVWTTVERASKPETGKEAGQISLPAETRKQDEGMSSTLLGAIAEFTDNDDVVMNLKVPRNFHYMKNATSFGNHTADVAVLIFDGFQNQDFQAVDQKETAPNGWRSFEQLRLEDPVRLRWTISQVLELENQTRAISTAVQNYRAFGGVALESVAPEVGIAGFSIRNFNALREESRDIFIPAVEKPLLQN